LVLIRTDSSLEEDRLAYSVAHDSKCDWVMEAFASDLVGLNSLSLDSWAAFLLFVDNLPITNLAKDHDIPSRMDYMCIMCSCLAATAQSWAVAC